MADDYYASLGVSRSASVEEIHQAYRNLVRQYHPDLNPDDAAAKKKFQEVQKAYEVLKDPKKRELFDRHGPAFESMGGGGPNGGPWRAGPGAAGPGGAAGRGQTFTEAEFRDLFGGGEDAGGGFSDLFRQFTGRGQKRGRQTAQRGHDIRHELEIAFRTAVAGGSAQVSIRRQNGKVETIDVKIPPGIESGKKIRLRGQGDPGPPGGTPGDVLITVRVAPHPAYTRAGNDLVARVPITLTEALIGAKIDVPTPKGTIALTVPPGTSSGKRLRIKGHGVQGRDKTGDLLAEIHIVLPETVDEEMRQRFQALNFPEPQNPRATLVW